MTIWLAASSGHLQRENYTRRGFGQGVARCILGPMSAFILPQRHELPLSATIGDVAVSLKCSALRYPVSQGGVTLILTHGISGRKFKRPLLAQTHA